MAGCAPLVLLLLLLMLLLCMLLLGLQRFREERGVRLLVHVMVR